MDALTRVILAVQEVKRAHEAQLMSLSNVVATGIGYKIAGETPTDEVSIIVSVSQKLPAAQLTEAAMVPKALDGLAKRCRHGQVHDPRYAVRRRIADGAGSHDPAALVGRNQSGHPLRRR